MTSQGVAANQTYNLRLAALRLIAFPVLSVKYQVQKDVSWAEG